jgi:dTDP-4-dehydrorhamnose reductase
MDFTNESQVKDLFARYKPSVVIHCGAISKPDECELNKEAAYLINVTGTSILLTEAKIHKSFFLFLSTDFVFDGGKGMYNEEDATGPVNYYGQTKLLAEKEVRNYTYDWAIARTVLVYGRSHLNRQNLVTNTAAALKRKEALKIFDDQYRTPTYVEDLARALSAIVRMKAVGIYHISGSELLTPYDMALRVADHLSLDRSLITPVTEAGFSQPARRPPRTGFNISKAKKLLDFEPTSFAEGLKKTLDNY